MAVVIGNYYFDGPFSRPEEVEETPGIYVVLAEDLGDEDNEPNAALEIVEVGFANNLQRELVDHENQDQWSVLYEGRLYAGVMYADEFPNLSVKEAFAKIQPGMFAQITCQPDPEDEDTDDEEDADDYEEPLIYQLSILTPTAEKVAV